MDGKVSSLLPNKLEGLHHWRIFYSCSSRHGFVVAITGIENIGKGLICDHIWFVTFPVKYQCVVFRPFKWEILEVVVTMVNKVYISFFFFFYLSDDLIYVMNMKIWIFFFLITSANMFNYMELSQMGFFDKAGPIQIFVSNHVSFNFPFIYCCSLRNGLLLLILCFLVHFKLFFLF